MCFARENTAKPSSTACQTCLEYKGYERLIRRRSASHWYAVAASASVHQQERAGNSGYEQDQEVAITVYRATPAGRCTIRRHDENGYRCRSALAQAVRHKSETGEGPWQIAAPPRQRQPSATGRYPATVQRAAMRLRHRASSGFWAR